MSTIFIVSGAFADPDIDTATASCSDDVFNSNTGPVNIEVNWEPNELELHWYNGDEEIQNVAVASQNCTYDSSLTPPSTIPTKTGYTFRGWKPKCVRSNLADLDTSISSNDWAAKKLINGGCNVSGNGDCTTYGLTENGEWAINFSYGMLKGMAICTARPSNNVSETYTNASSNWRAPVSELTTAGVGDNCWCQAQTFTRSSDGKKCVLNMDPIFVRTLTDNCLNACAQRCANLISYSVSDNKRIALYIQ